MIPRLMRTRLVQIVVPLHVFCAGCARPFASASPGGPVSAMPSQDASPESGGNPYGLAETTEAFQADMELPAPALFEGLRKEIEARHGNDGGAGIVLEELDLLKQLAGLARDLDRHTIRTEPGDKGRWQEFLAAVKNLARLRAQLLSRQSDAGQPVEESGIQPRTMGTYRNELWSAIQQRDDKNILTKWDAAVRELPPEDLPVEVLPEVARAAARQGDTARAAGYLESYLKTQRYEDIPALTAELAAYFASQGDYARARDSYERVIVRMKQLESIEESSRERIQILDQREKDEAAHARAKLIQAEAIFAYGTDYPVAHRLIAEVMAETRDTGIQTRAQALIEGFRQRRAQLLEADIARLRADYANNRLDADEVRKRALELRMTYPEADLQTVITASVMEIERSEGRTAELKAANDQKKIQAADLAMKEGKYAEAVLLLRELVASPTEGQKAMSRLPDAIDAVVKSQREKVGDAVAKAMKIKDPAARKVALAGAQAQLQQLALDYPGSSVISLIEKDIKLLGSQIDKLNSSLVPSPDTSGPSPSL